MNGQCIPWECTEQAWPRSSFKLKTRTFLDKGRQKLYSYIWIRLQHVTWIIFSFPILYSVSISFSIQAPKIRIHNHLTFLVTSSLGATPFYGNTTVRNPQFTETHFTDTHFTETHFTETHVTDNAFYGHASYGQRKLRKRKLRTRKLRKRTLRTTHFTDTQVMDNAGYGNARYGQRTLRTRKLWTTQVTETQVTETRVTDNALYGRASYGQRKLRKRKLRKRTKTLDRSKPWCYIHLRWSCFQGFYSDAFIPLYLAL